MRNLSKRFINSFDFFSLGKFKKEVRTTDYSESIKKDWEMIGDDIRRVMTDIEKVMRCR